MSENTYTTSAEVELHAHRGNLTIRFCDASVAQWEEDMGPLVDYRDDDELRKYVVEAIVANADDLAESLVQDLRKRLGDTDEQ